MSDDRYVDSPPAGADGWREVWESDARYRPRPSRNEWLLRFFRRIFRRAVEPDNERQKNFNVAVLDLLGDIRRELVTFRDDLKRDLTAVQLDVRNADEALATEIARIRELIPIAARRNDALIAAIDQKIESVAARLRDITTPLLQTTDNRQPTTSDFLYRRLEDALRGEVDVEDYVVRARDNQPALDIGCGRGEFLEACKTAGIEARGFDVNERSVADLQKRGFDVALAGIPECFEGIRHASIGSVVAMHVVEHLPVEQLFALFAQSARVLRPGGLLMIETPNAESIAVSASDFWRDPTHIAPRHVAALTILAREHGFSIEDVRAIHPLPAGNEIAYSPDDPESVRHIAEIINERVLAPQDLRLILKRS
ncbi:MAG TPA: class I SAM-dependent methyltransferase [Thermoanaerobaculia bacterium]|nr:class I SAM-dependent methyltransferase [Thermoanaerobaculia bacterium]